MLASPLRALGAALLVVVAAGCSAAEQKALLAHRVDVLEDSLGDAPAPASAAALASAVAAPLEVDVLVDGFAGDARHVLAAVVDALDAHPAVRVRSLRYQGAQAAFGRRRRGDAPAPLTLRLACRFEADGAWTNPLVAFPGLLVFAPVWLGYRWDARVELEARVGPPGREGPPATHAVAATFRERNARRSALFHLWPSNGVFGLQFVAAVVLAPTFLAYDGDEATPALVAALAPRLAPALSGFVVERLRAAAAGRRGARAPADGEHALAAPSR